MSMVAGGTTQTFYYSLEGADPACASGAGSAGNSCGIHIHSGTSCTEDALGHYYTGAVTSDPWTSIAYTSDTSGATSGSVVVDTGGTYSEVIGRALIIHAYDGSRIGCALLSDGASASLAASAFVPYYSYAGNLTSVGGSVGPMTTSGTTQTFSYALENADPACASGAGTAGERWRDLHTHHRHRACR